MEDLRQSKQHIKIEDKLGIIQQSAMMSNVEKRKQLMSQADKRYFGHIQETIDRISRMKEVK